MASRGVARLLDACAVVVAARMGPRIAPRFFRRIAAKIEAQHGAGDLRDATLDVHDATGRLSQRVREVSP